MKKWLLIWLTLLAGGLGLVPWCFAQCGPGGCCPGGECGRGVGDWRSAMRPAEPSTPAKANASENTADCYRSVVRVETLDRDGTQSLGSGVALAWKGHVVVLTAGHVVCDSRRIWIRNTTKIHTARIIKTDRAWDVAVLQPLGSGRFDCARLAWREGGMLRSGDRLESCGLGPAGGRLAVNRGRFLHYARSSARSAATDWLVMTGTARQGDSGGPVFNREGELVGILWGTDGQTVVATQCGRLHVVLGEAMRDEDEGVRDRAFGIRTSQQSEAPSRQSLTVIPQSLACSGRLLPICRPRGPESSPAPQVIVQSDPEVSRKLDVLIANTSPRPSASDNETERPEPSTSPIVVVLVVCGAVALGFIVFFSVARSS